MKTKLRSLLLLTPALLAACSRANGAPAALTVREAAGPTAAVRVAAPAARLEGETARATGELRARLQATVSAKASGTILKVHVRPGDRVRSGDALVALDPTTLLIQLDQARAARKTALAVRENAAADLARARQLHEAGSAPQAVLDKVTAGAAQADGAFEQADAQTRLLEQSLRDQVVRAPFDGVVTARLKNVGDAVAMMPPTPIATLVAAGDLELRLSVPEGLVEPLRRGAVLQGRTLPGRAPFEARVTSVGVTVDAATRAVEVLADVRPGRGAEAQLRSGGLAEVDLGGTAAGEGPFVPSLAVTRDGEQSYLWTVADGVARRRPVRIEPVTPRWVRVRGGLNEGEKVVVEGAAGLTDGMRVAVAG
jgi:RND family efflux transporter MFP subunit